MVEMTTFIVYVHRDDGMNTGPRHSHSPAHSHTILEAIHLYVSAISIYQYQKLSNVWQ